MYQNEAAQEAKKNDVYYMGLALTEAKQAAALGEVPVGAVIVKEGKVLAQAGNRRETAKSAVAHAEVLAIQQACELLSSWRLSDCTVYVTLEPCPMCAGALFLSRIKRLVYGAADSKMGGAESIFNIVNNNALNHQMQVTAGVCEKECQQLLKEFFHARR